MNGKETPYVIFNGSARIFIFIDFFWGDIMWNIIATILVFAVIAAGLVAVYQQFGQGQAQQSAQNLSTQVSTTAATIANTYAGNPDLSQIQTAVAGLVPSQWASTGSGNFSLPDGGTVSFAPTSVNGASAKNAYTMTFNTLNQAQCQSLSAFQTAKTASITVNGTTISNPAYGNANSNPPWGSNLAYACTSGATNKLVFTIAG